MLDDDSPRLFSLIPRARAFRKNPTPSEALLWAEVEGGVHRRPDVARYDALRQEALEAAGFRVLRLEAELVERDLPAALAAIRGALRR